VAESVGSPRWSASGDDRGSCRENLSLVLVIPSSLNERLIIVERSRTTTPERSTGVGLASLIAARLRSGGGGVRDHYGIADGDRGESLVRRHSRRRSAAVDASTRHLGTT